MFRPPISLQDLWPAEAVVAIRPDDNAMDWLSPSPAWHERITGVPLVLAGSLPVLCHEAAADSDALELLRDCGLPLTPDIVTFSGAADARAALGRLAAAGHRIGTMYGARQAHLPAAAYVNDPGMAAFLNDKANLADLLPAGAVPPRTMVEMAELAGALESRRHALPLVLKAATGLGSGSGLDVAICRTPADFTAARRRMERADRVIIEEFCDFGATWCLHFAASDAGVVFCGATEQVCDADGGYHGNWREEGRGPGDDAVTLGMGAAREGWARGYRGFLGIDVGRTADRRWLAFDPNFRLNGSTAQALLGGAIDAEWGTGCTRALNGVPFDGTFGEMLGRIRAFNERRELVPVLLFDAARLGLADGDGLPTCSILAAGTDRRAVRGVLGRLRAAGFGVAPDA